MRRIRERLHDGEDGFTIVEILVASAILVLASLAVFMAFASAVKNVQRSREAQIGISVAQREMERVRVIPFDSIRLSSTPGSLDGGAETPYPRISEEGGLTMFDVARRTAAIENQPLVEGESPDGAPAEVEVESPEPMRANDGTEVIVYRFVTCEDPPDCDAKRIVIDVQPVAKANLAGFRHSYKELQSTVVDPEAGLEP